MSCSCSCPREGADPRREGSCNQCGKLIDPSCTSNDKTAAEFFNYLASALHGPSSAWESFRRECEVRERDGRGHFGLAFLGRDNLEEASQEFSDGANYLLFDHLKEVRRNGDDREVDLVLTVAWHAFKASEGVALLRAKRHGSP